MNMIFALALLIVSQSVIAAPYYRFWRGEKLAQLNETTYMKTMAKDFLPMAPKLFPHLKSYLVAMPEVGVGVDEVALLAYTNEEDYFRGRATAEGTAYSNAHWEIFERATSSSLVPEVLEGKVAANKSYDLLKTTPDWSKGYSTFFIGKKRSILSTEKFLAGLDAHVREFRQGFQPMGLKGYVILVTEDREYAWMSWESEAHANKAFATQLGAKVQKDAGELMEMLQWSGLTKFGNSLKRNHAYFVQTK
jgi:hypothetical protein